jgi:predicted acylesterase/phospholipase RssA
MLSRILACLGLCLLSACATSGAVELDCNGFDRPTPAGLELRHRLPPSKYEAEIHSDTGTDVEPDSYLQPVLTRSFAARAAKGFVEGEGPAAMLLSGGGQWGAFGAGFLKKLDELDRTNPLEEPRLPDFSVVTGVSTGGLQALFVALDSEEDYAKLSKHYLPASERDVVARHAMWQAAVRGSVAGLKPLRRRIEEGLCPAGPEAGCPLIQKLARLENKQVLVGFVEAASGDFFYVDAVEIAKRYEDDHREAQQCLTAAALASAAMPVFFQQVRINDRTYYDGGVRQSVFDARLAAQVEMAAAALTGAPPASLYVIRNGPTHVLPATPVPGSRYMTKPDVKADALENATRAESIVVNQLEVGSIAALRLEHPYGKIRFVTADGYGNPRPSGGGCHKLPEVMFDPDFMECLQYYGARKAERKEPWRRLSAIPGIPPKKRP